METTKDLEMIKLERFAKLLHEHGLTHIRNTYKPLDQLSYEMRLTNEEIIYIRFWIKNGYLSLGFKLEGRFFVNRFMPRMKELKQADYYSPTLQIWKDWLVAKENLRRAKARHDNLAIYLAQIDVQACIDFARHHADEDFQAFESYWVADIMEQRSSKPRDLNIEKVVLGEFSLA